MTISTTWAVAVVALAVAMTPVAHTLPLPSPSELGAVLPAGIPAGSDSSAGGWQAKLAAMQQTKQFQQLQQKVAGATGKGNSSEEASAMLPPTKPAAKEKGIGADGCKRDEGGNLQCDCPKKLQYEEVIARGLPCSHAIESMDHEKSSECPACKCECATRPEWMQANVPKPAENADQLRGSGQWGKCGSVVLDSGVPRAGDPFVPEQGTKCPACECDSINADLIESRMLELNVKPDEMCSKALSTSPTCLCTCAQNEPLRSKIAFLTSSCLTNDFPDKCIVMLNATRAKLPPGVEHALHEHAAPSNAGDQAAQGEASRSLLDTLKSAATTRLADEAAAEEAEQRDNPSLDDVDKPQEESTSNKGLKLLNNMLGGNKGPAAATLGAVMGGGLLARQGAICLPCPKFVPRVPCAEAFAGHKGKLYSAKCKCKCVRETDVDCERNDDLPTQCRPSAEQETADDNTDDDSPTGGENANAATAAAASSSGSAVSSAGSEESSGEESSMSVDVGDSTDACQGDVGEFLAMCARLADVAREKGEEKPAPEMCMEAAGLSQSANANEFRMCSCVHKRLFPGAVKVTSDVLEQLKVEHKHTDTYWWCKDRFHMHPLPAIQPGKETKDDAGEDGDDDDDNADGLGNNGSGAVDHHEYPVGAAGELTEESGSSGSGSGENAATKREQKKYAKLPCGMESAHLLTWCAKIMDDVRETKEVAKREEVCANRLGAKPHERPKQHEKCSCVYDRFLTDIPAVHEKVKSRLLGTDAHQSTYKFCVRSLGVKFIPTPKH